ncbi:Ger(x)C family spore germination protein [Alteribacillus iranensis]|uniref:Germination protein, Ger(X)C family n=1 Tax=Alteribacillus iranensis TaxID=930128 RepID=A0A1I2DLG4_9BACI|nr:Ger(x)C family spore germination protein [Alteribacillus iranensis]SFE80760.1 germination protein, Ger(x)C family [Alteribacillus iranensis]
MINPRIYFFFSLFVFVPLLSGCWDSLDVEKRASVLGIAIDKVDPAEAKKEENQISHLKEEGESSNEQYIRLTAQIAVPGRVPLNALAGGGEGGAQESVWVLSVVGHSLDDAILNLQQEVADPLFFGHLRIIVFSEKVASEGVQKFNDYLRRQPQVRRTAWMAVSKENAKKYMEIAPELEPIPALYLSSMVEDAVGAGKLPYDSIGIFWIALSNLGQDGFLPYLTIGEKHNVRVEGVGYFTGDKMKGTIEPIKIGPLMTILGEEQGGYGLMTNMPGTEDKVLVRATKRRSNIKTAIKNEEKPEIRIKIRYDVRIEENESPTYSLDSPEIIRKIEDRYSEEVKDAYEQFIQDMQKEGSDIFGFGEYIRAKQPTYWEKKVKTQEQWRSIYTSQLDVQVEVQTRITQIGMKEQ